MQIQRVANMSKVNAWTVNGLKWNEKWPCFAQRKRHSIFQRTNRTIIKAQLYLSVEILNATALADSLHTDLRSSNKLPFTMDCT